MKTIYTIILTFASLLLITSLSAQAPSLEWASSCGGTQTDIGNAITTDINGNVLITGSFKGTVDFDPGPDVLELSSNGEMDIFIQKLDSEGNFIWVKQMGGIEDDNGLSISTDAMGNVYSSGYYSGTVDFDPGSAILENTASGEKDIFIQKLDPNGNFVWIKNIGGTETEEASEITIDIDGDIYICGSFEGIVDFDPGIEILEYTSNGDTDIFIMKLDPVGNLIWSKQIGGSSFDNANSITTDLNGHVYTTGRFTFEIDFDPGPATVNLNPDGGTDAFYLKLDADGDFLWARNIGGESLISSNSITTDNEGNVYSSGNFRSELTINSGSVLYNLSSNGWSDIFILKLSSNGNLLWVKNMGGVVIDSSESVATDDEGNVYIIGSFSEAIDFDSSGVISHLSNNGTSDVYIQKMDAFGNSIWVAQIGGSGHDFGLSIALDMNNNIYATGSFRESVDFDPGMESVNLSSNNDSRDVFVVKLSNPPVGITESTFEENIQLYPNPTAGEFAVSFESIQEELNLRILSITGQLIEENTFLNTNQVQMNLDQPNGLYFLEMTNEEGKKMVVRLVKE